MNYIELAQKAREAQNGSYSPYSKFRVGAALLTDDGEVILGANVENASYGLTSCAERNAITRAINDGKKKI
jgi:cytidine deaminase